MRHLFRGFFAGWLCLALGVTLAQATERSEGCAVAGVVTDHRGSPIAHAIVSIFRDGDEKEVLVTASSDRSGRFALARLTPGVYRLLAAARGFQTLISEPTALAPGQTSQMRLTLRPVPDARATGVNPVKYQNRRNRGIFNATASETPDAVRPGAPLWQGTALIGSTGYDSQMTAEVTPGVDVGAYLRRDWEGRSVTIGGALRYSAGQHRGRIRWQTDQVTADPVTAGPVTAGPVMASPAAPVPGGPFFRHDLQAADTWQITDRLQVLYGFDYLRVGRRQEDVWQPRLAARWQPCTAVQVHTALTSDGQSFPAWVDPERPLLTDDFPAPPARLALVDERPVLARNLRVEAGVAWQMDPRTTVQVYAYQDWLDGHPLALDGRVLSRLDGRAHGTAVIVTRRLRPHLAVTTGYAAGRTATRPEDEGFAASTWPPGAYHVLTVVAETVFPGPETRIQVGYRSAWGHPVHAIDPFTGRLPFTDAGLNFRIIQALPGWIFLPGRWEAVVEGRNLDERRSEVTGLGAAFGFPHRRTVRGGLRFRF
jgi:hypothetical protein